MSNDRMNEELEQAAFEEMIKAIDVARYQYSARLIAIRGLKNLHLESQAEYANVSAAVQSVVSAIEGPFTKKMVVSNVRIIEPSAHPSAITAAIRRLVKSGELLMDAPGLYRRKVA